MLYKQLLTPGRHGLAQEVIKGLERLEDSMLDLLLLRQDLLLEIGFVLGLCRLRDCAIFVVGWLRLRLHERDLSLGLCGWLSWLLLGRSSEHIGLLGRLSCWLWLLAEEACIGGWLTKHLYKYVLNYNML